MKILFISDVYFPRVNGVSTSIQTFRHALRELGHTVHLIAPDYQLASPDETDILRIPARRVPLDPEDRLMSYRQVMRHLQQFRAENYDLIHIQTPFVAHYLGTRLSKRLGIPCVETYHTFFEEYLHHYVPLVPKRWMQSIAKRFSRHQGNSLNGMVVPSRPMREVLKNYGITTPTKVIPTGLEAESFVLGDRDAFRLKHAIPAERPVLLFLGRVAHEKNIGFLLKVVSEVKKSLPEILLVIAGEGPAQKSLAEEVSKLELTSHVQFIGYLDRLTELNSCYRAADLFVFASRTETQGLVLLEAMAQGTAVVSTAELGTRDVLIEGEGVWIAREDEVEFSNKIICLIKEHDTRHNLGKTGREYAQNWSASRQAESMLTFYHSVLAAHCETVAVPSPI